MNDLYFFIQIIEILLIILFFFLLKNYLPSYFSEKGKNLATKEDIAVITKQSEEIKNLYSKQMENLVQQNRIILEEYKNKNQLRLAALDKRLEAHQKAYVLWKEAAHSIHNSDKINEIVIECQNWWHNNCLYLTADARDAFWNSFMAASLHKDLLESHKAIRSEETKKEVKENWHTIMQAGRIIAEGVTLPPTNEQLEIKELEI